MLHLKDLHLPQPHKPATVKFTVPHCQIPIFAYTFAKNKDALRDNNVMAKMEDVVCFFDFKNKTQSLYKKTEHKIIHSHVILYITEIIHLYFLFYISYLFSRAIFLLTLIHCILGIHLNTALEVLTFIDLVPLITQPNKTVLYVWGTKREMKAHNPSLTPLLHRVASEDI